jgi:hypothetical protein
MWRSLIIADVLLRTAALALLVTVAPSTSTDRRTYTITLPMGRALGVELTIGSIRVEGESRRDARIDIVRSAPTADALTRIPVVVDETDAAVHVSSVQPNGETDPALRTDVSLRVPQGATLHTLRVMEGRIALTALSGSVTADVRRGPIEATRVEGTVRLETGIGDVIAREMRLAPPGLLRLRAFNGDVRLELRERPADARVMALALNGTIQSTIPLTMRDTWGPRWAEATLGSGEPVISLDVITGKIEIKAP